MNNCSHVEDRTRPGGYMIRVSAVAVKQRAKAQWEAVVNLRAHLGVSPRSSNAKGLLLVVDWGLERGLS